MLGYGIISSSASGIISVEKEDQIMERDEKPSLYEYFGGSNPQVKITLILLSDFLHILFNIIIDRLK